MPGALNPVRDECCPVIVCYPDIASVRVCPGKIKIAGIQNYLHLVVCQSRSGGIGDRNRRSVLPAGIIPVLSNNNLCRKETGNNDRQDS